MSFETLVARECEHHFFVKMALVTQMCGKLSADNRCRACLVLLWRFCYVMKGIWDASTEYIPCRKFRACKIQS